MCDMISVANVELKVFQMEEIRIVIRKLTSESIPEYEYERRCSGNTMVKDFVRNRLGLELGDVEVITGNGEFATPRMTMDYVRNSYNLN